MEKNNKTKLYENMTTANKIKIYKQTSRKFLSSKQEGP